MARVPPVLQAASLKPLEPMRFPPAMQRGVPPVLQAASLKPVMPFGKRDQIRRVPPVLQAASLKLNHRHGCGGAFGERSACIAGGLIEARSA